jgi:Flp pilus assembly protein TadD
MDPFADLHIRTWELASSGQAAAAEELLRQGIAAARLERNLPKLGTLYRTAAMIAETSGDLRQAAHHYEAAMEVEPDNVRLHSALAVLYWRIGETALAESHLKAFEDGVRSSGDPQLREVLEAVLKKLDR